MGERVAEASCLPSYGAAWCYPYRLPFSPAVEASVKGMMKSLWSP